MSATAYAGCAPSSIKFITSLVETCADMPGGARTSPVVDLQSAGCPPNRHSALLSTTVHLPQLHVPRFGTVVLEMSRLPHHIIRLTFRRKLEAYLFR